MDPMRRAGGPCLSTKKAILSLACIHGLVARPLTAWAEEGGDGDATVVEGAEGAEESDLSDTADLPEDSDSTSVEAGSGERDDEPPSAEDSDALEVVDDSVDQEVTAESTAESASPSGVEAVEPLDEGANDAGASDVQPDYFGGLEPTSPIYQLEEPQPEKPQYTGPFRAGALRLGLGIGAGGYGDQTYLILGFGVGYFLVNGLEVHIDTDFWLIGEPFIATPSPGLRYVMWFVPKVHPYVGGFYRHYFAGSGYPDANSIGARGGVYLMTGQNSYFGLGAAYEHMLDDDLFVQTDFIYPEIAFAFSF